MITQVKHVSVPVKNQDEALEFYTKKLGFKLVVDVEAGDQRWIELEIPGGETCVVLFTPEGHEERIGSADCSKGFILDGFPRTIHQAEVITDHFKESADIVAISLELSDTEIIERIVGRIVCVSCQASFHLTLAPPVKAGRCDTCMGTLTQRSDDNEAVAMRRLEIYREQTTPLIEYYESRGLLHPINSNQSKEAILLQILTTMKKDKKYSHPDR